MTTTAITWFEIPALDMNRAVRFYESVLQGSLRRDTMGDSQIAIFPFQDPGVGGCVTKGPNMAPVNNGSIVYLRVSGLNDVLERVSRAGGQVLLGKTRLPEGMGSYAHILDCEGNRVGLHAYE